MGNDFGGGEVDCELMKLSGLSLELKLKVVICGIGDLRHELAGSLYREGKGEQVKHGKELAVVGW